MPKLNLPENYDPWDVTEDYKSIVRDFCHDLGYELGITKISDHPCGELVIFISGVYSGYLDDYINHGKTWFLDSEYLEDLRDYNDYQEWLSSHGHCDQASWECPDEEDCPYKNGHIVPVTNLLGVHLKENNND